MTGIAKALLEGMDAEDRAELARELAPYMVPYLPTGAPSLLTAQEAGRILGRHPKTMNRYAAEGRIRAERVGRGWRFFPHDMAVTPKANETPAPRRPRNVQPRPATRPSVDAIRG